MSRTVKATVRVLTPMVPNFVQTTDGQTVAVSTLTDDELREIGANWTEELIAKAHRQRANVNREYERRRAPQ